MGLSWCHPPLDLPDAHQAPPRSVGPIHHLDLARGNGDVRRGSWMGPVALFAAAALPIEAAAFPLALCRLDVVAPLCRPALRRVHGHLDFQRAALDGSVGLASE